MHVTLHFDAIGLGVGETLCTDTLTRATAFTKSPIRPSATTQPD